MEPSQSKSGCSGLSSHQAMPWTCLADGLVELTWKLKPHYQNPIVVDSESESERSPVSVTAWAAVTVTLQEGPGPGPPEQLGCLSQESPHPFGPDQSVAKSLQYISLGRLQLCSAASRYAVFRTLASISCYWDGQPPECVSDLGQQSITCQTKLHYQDNSDRSTAAVTWLNRLSLWASITDLRSFFSPAALLKEHPLLQLGKAPICLYNIDWLCQ